MKLPKLILLFLMAMGVNLYTQAQTRMLAFPGAEGYGKYATGGRGGKTYVVTSLDDCDESKLKEGTFRWAVKQPGKKIVTFAVNGTIYLKSALNLDCGDLTILGQTAPGEGICIADYPVTISCENAIIRYIRIRLGNRQVAFHEGDGFGFNGANNVIMDHCSISWSIDECLSISAATNLTIQWCMVEQALNKGGHVKGEHGYGGNWGGTNVSFHHNLITQCKSRVPRLGGDTSPLTEDFCDLRNNVFYNWGGNGCYGAEAIDVNFVNNYYKPGPLTDTSASNIRKRICGIGIRTNSYIQTFPAFAHDLHKWGHFYTDGNVNPDYEDMTKDNWTIGILNQVNASGCDGTWTATTKDTIHLREPREFMSVTTHSAEDAYDKVMALAGASLYRDCVDNLMVAQVMARLGDDNSGSSGSTKGLIDCQSDNNLSSAEVENGAWPILKYIAPEKTDSDGDGIPDQYESSWGLDYNDGTDGAGIYTSSNPNYNGYAYVEIYQNLTNKTNKAWNEACLEGGTLLGVEEPTILCERRHSWEHEVSLLTFKGYDSSKKQQHFSDGLMLNGTSGLAGATGNDMTLKLKAQQYTITIPAGITATKLRICGYSNYTGNNIYISECGGTKYGSNDYVIDATSGVWSDITIPLSKPVSNGKLTVTFAGNSPTVKFYVIDDTETAGIQSIQQGAEQLATDNRYYTLSGQLCTQPGKGLYIINGKKVLIR